MDTTSTEAADLATLLDVASRVSMTLELGPLLRLILDQLKVVADYSGSSICVVEGDDLCIMESRGGSAADREEAILGVRLPLSRGGEFWQQLAQGEPVVIDDVRGPSAMAAAYRRFVGTHFESEAIRYIRSFLAVPLRHRDQVIGLITLSKAEPHVYTSRHAHLAGAVAVHAAAAIANARLYEEVRNAQAASARQVERLQTLMAITKELLIATEVERVLDLVVAAAARLVTAAGATLGLIEDGTEQIAIAAIAGEPLTDSTAAASNVVVPILDDGVPIGILRVYDDISRTFVDDDVRLVQSLANLGALVIAHARLLARGNDAAVLEERARLARDLHDSVTQSLFSLGMLARAAHRQFELQDVRLYNTLERVADLAHDSLVEMRALLFELDPASLAEKGLSQALSDLITSGGREEGPRISFTSTMTAQPKPEITVAMFRIVQEALTNARKHAHAASICVTLAETDGQVVLTVADDGVGFDPAGPRPVTADARSGGMGMRSMRERADAAGLTLTVHSAPGAGTAVLVAAPIGGDDTAIVETTPN